MAARPRRRRRASPRRRIRRIWRRQDRLTRGLLVAVVCLTALIGVLFVPLLKEQRRPRPAELAGETAPAPAIARKRPRAAPPVRREASSARRTPQNPPGATGVPARAPGAASPSQPQPRAAIVIDDLGQRIEHFEQIVRLDFPITIAVLPGLPATARTVREAARLGIEVLLHQPMEPREEGGKDPGPGVLLVSMTPGELRAQMTRSFEAVPGAVGVNNHMGSRFTEDPAALALLVDELKPRGLFWLDSRTTAATRGAAVARAAGVPAIERDVFIDAETETDFIRAQLRKLLEKARRNGSAVGIGHPHPQTLAVLQELRGELLASGVALVPVSQLVPPLPATVAALEARGAPARAGHAARAQARAPTP